MANFPDIRSHRADGYRRLVVWKNVVLCCNGCEGTGGVIVLVIAAEVQLFVPPISSSSLRHSLESLFWL